jgi:DNA-binding MarR family transcriptional regulator
MDGPHWLDDRELTVWKDFLTVSMLLNRIVDQRLRDESGLSQAQYEILVQLAEAPGRERRMTDLACAALISKSNLTYHVTQLEKAGLVCRCSSAGDERGVVASLTDEGWNKLRETAPGHAAFVREWFIDPHTAASFAGLADGLGALADRLREHTGTNAV